MLVRCTPAGARRASGRRCVGELVRWWAGWWIS